MYIQSMLKMFNETWVLMSLIVAWDTFNERPILISVLSSVAQQHNVERHPGSFADTYYCERRLAQSRNIGARDDLPSHPTHFFMFTPRVNPRNFRFWTKFQKHSLKKTSENSRKRTGGLRGRLPRQSTCIFGGILATLIATLEGVKLHPRENLPRAPALRKPVRFSAPVSNNHHMTSTWGHETDQTFVRISYMFGSHRFIF